VYDKVRALDFPPFEPAWVELEDGRKLYLTASDYEYMIRRGRGGRLKQTLHEGPWARYAASSVRPTSATFHVSLDFTAYSRKHPFVYL